MDASFWMPLLNSHSAGVVCVDHGHGGLDIVKSEAKQPGWHDIIDGMLHLFVGVNRWK